MKHRIESVIEIQAAPHEVWEVLTDLDAYESWNPFIISSDGVVATGERITNRMAPPGGREMTFRPVVTIVEPNRTFEWLGRMGIPGLFDGRHRFEMEPTDTGTRLVHGEAFSGILVRTLVKSLDTATLQGFRAMNEALKVRVESGTRAKADAPSSHSDPT